MNLFLTEFGESVVAVLDDAVGDALSRSGIVTAVRLGQGQWQITPSSKVGVASIGDLTVWIQPKVAIHRILFMLGFARDPGWRTEDVALEGVDDLVPALASAFADQADRALQLGPLQGYVTVDDSLTVLRGRLREQDQLRHRFGIALPLLVRYDDYSVDIAENRSLRAAADALLRVRGVDADTRARLRHVQVQLAEVSTLVRGAPLPTWQMSRLNRRYEVALWLAELILRDNAVDQAAGDVRVGGFIVDMAKVYEDFLTAALTDAFRAFGGHSAAQDSHFLDVASTIRMKPDFVWYDGKEPGVVIDAKYKAEKPAGFPDADQYQMLAYCTALKLRDGHLVYAKGNEAGARASVRNVDVTIHSHTLDLDVPPKDLLAQITVLTKRIVSMSRSEALAS